VKLPWTRPEGEWRAVSRGALAAWAACYALFLLYAAFHRGGFLFLDYVNLSTHEAGHFLFGWLGYTLMILGGTLGELLVPFLLAAYFRWHRHATGVAFCVFWFFENFLYIGAYMADARAQALPLVGTGEHDWEILFSRWNLLTADTTIGGVTRAVGWAGMVAVVGWLIWRGRHPRE
jgi:hypothetical protein